MAEPTLSLLVRAEQPIWVDAPAAMAPELARKLGALLVDARGVPGPILAETLRGLVSSSSALVVSLGDAMPLDQEQVLYALLHGQVHAPDGGESTPWPATRGPFLVGLRAGVPERLRRKLRLRVTPAKLGLTGAPTPGGASRGSGGSPRGPVPRSAAVSRPSRPTRPIGR